MRKTILPLVLGIGLYAGVTACGHSVEPKPETPASVSTPAVPEFVEEVPTTDPESYPVTEQDRLLFQMTLLDIGEEAMAESCYSVEMMGQEWTVQFLKDLNPAPTYDVNAQVALLAEWCQERGSING